MSNTSSVSQSSTDENKRIRRLYQTLLERRPLKYWSVLDFPYLAEIVRHDSSYLRRILNFVFVDHPALSQYLTIIAWRELAKQMSQSSNPNISVKSEMLPIGFERTLWVMYRRQKELSDLWASKTETENVGNDEELSSLTFQEFISKINGTTT